MLSKLKLALRVFRQVTLLYYLLFAVLIISFGIFWNVADVFRGFGRGSIAHVGPTDITATEFKFDPSMVELAKSGEMTFTLVNDGQLTHALEIEGQGIEEESDEIDGGASTDLTVDLEAGEYELYCPVGNHREQGMEGTLVVGGAAGGGGMTTEETETEESGGYGG